MEQVYNRMSSRNSLTDTEKIIEENDKSVGNENSLNEKRGLRKWAQNWDKLVYTFCILVNYLHYGLCINLFPPAMVDMRFLYRTSTENISYGNTFNGAGYISGSLIGFLYKYINRQLSFIVFIVILGVFVATEPIGTSLWQFYLSMYLNGVGMGVFDSGNTVWVVEMWGESSPPVLQLSQMMYGCGSIVGPLIVSPFIYGDLSNKTETETTGHPNSPLVSTASTLINTTLFLNTTDDDINYSVDRRSKLIIPFISSGVLTLTIPVVLLVMFFIKRYKVPENRIQAAIEKTASDHAINGNPDQPPIEISGRTRTILIVLVALSLNSDSGLELTFFNYSSTYYQYLPIHLSAQTAAHVMSVMTVTYAFGRGVSAYISSKLRPEVMLSYHIIIIFISLAILYFGQNSETLIWIGNALIGFGFSAMWPCYFAFSEKHLRLTDKVTSIFSFVSSLFSLFAPFIVGRLIEKHPEVLLYVVFGLLCTVLLLFIVIMVIVKRAQRYPVLYTINNS